MIVSCELLSMLLLMLNWIWCSTFVVFCFFFCAGDDTASLANILQRCSFVCTEDRIENHIYRPRDIESQNCWEIPCPSTQHPRIPMKHLGCSCRQARTVSTAGYLIYDWTDQSFVSSLCSFRCWRGDYY